MGADWRLRRGAMPRKMMSSWPLSSKWRYLLGICLYRLVTFTSTMGEPLRTSTSHTSVSSFEEKPLTMTRPVCAISVAQSRVGSTDSGAILLGARKAVIGCFSRSIFPRYSITSRSSCCSDSCYSSLHQDIPHGHNKNRHKGIILEFYTMK